jgi:ABC-type uncharacterized transport system permease subunit
MAELLFWPAALAYAEAVFAYAGSLRDASYGRLATWGVRVGWLAQTALLVAQAARADGFPWASWAGSLNLFVWFVVSAYLIWGCRARYRLLGLAVMPLAASLFVLARIGGGTGLGGRSHYSNLFLVLHAGLVLAAFAGFTLAAALSGLYLWQERRLKRHSADLLRLGPPALVTLDEVAGKTIAVALPLFTAGIAAGFVRLAVDGGRWDALMGLTVVAWAVYGGYLVLRYRHGRRGKGIAYVALIGFALVIVARLGLQLTHFSS